MNKLKNKFFHWKLALSLIVLIGFFLRVYKLEVVPNGFHADEAAFGYNAYSILHTLKDEYGKFLPIVLKSFGDYKGALYAYLDIPFVALFGLTPFAERLPSAILSSATILLMYFFTQKLLKNRNIALIASFIFAILPWSITISRTTGDVTIATFFAFLMGYALLSLMEKFSKFWLITAVLSAMFSIITYAPFRFYAIMIPALFFVISIKKTKRVEVNKSLLLVILTVVVLGMVYSRAASIERFNQVSIFSNPKTELILQEQIREDEYQPVLQTRVFHNKVINFSRTILQNTGQYFTLDYLFLSGGYPFRERIPNQGLFYIWEAPFLLIGIYAILKRKKRHEILLLLWWIILLLPTVITFDEIPNVHRNLIIMPAIVIIIAAGIYEFFNVLGKKTVRLALFIGIALLVIIAYEFSYFMHQYFLHFDLHQPWYRGYAYKELVRDLNEYYPKYKKIVITKSNSSPYIYILFFSKYDPGKYQAEGSPRDLDYTGFDKYFFVPLDCSLNGGKNGEDEINGEIGVLYVDLGTCVTPLKNAKVLKTVEWGDGSSAFKLMEYVSTESAKTK